MVIRLRDWTYAQPVKVAGPEDGCQFYHWMDVPHPPPATGYVTVPGAWDLRGRFEDYIGGVDVAGKSVLDVGTATGWISFEAERHGAAQVVGLDAADDVVPQHVPYLRHGDRDRPATPAAGEYMPFRTGIRRSYWLCHERLGSSAAVVHGDIYKAGEHISGADIVIVGQILVHQRDPLEALLQCARAADDTLIIVEGSFETDQPVMKFCGLNGIYYSWFLLSSAMYVEYLRLLGFELKSVTKNLYRCTHADATPEMEIWSYVARRVGPTLGRP
ncbi:MAG: class I SAM-dependent methyltransferase [Xanthobacteraceae bacterium]|nr:class I SAM-dependent methyltransferase [Xanthobacteraceae bacterium]